MRTLDNIGIRPDRRDFAPQKLYPEPKGPKYLKLLAIFLVGLGFGYSFLNFPALWKNFSYRLSKPQGLSLKSTIVKTFPSFPLINPYNPYQETPYNTLIIESIAVRAPITWGVTKETVAQDLKKGVVQFKGTNLITGHSSDFWWNEGDFKTVFALLPEIEKGAEIKVFREGKEYNYRVEEIKVVSPNKVLDFLDKDKENLVLMTCYPLGTDLRRLLVRAVRI